MRTRYYPIILLLLISSVVLFVVTCKKEAGPVEPSQTNLTGFSSLTIGSSGGKVVDSYGASITVPAGALSSNTTISVRTVRADSVPSELQSTVVGNIIECLPNGATFLQPVTIVLPITSGIKYRPGDTANLYMYNSDSSSWEMTKIPAIVIADSLHLQASVSHFTNYGSGTPGGYSGGGNSFSGIKNWLEFQTAADDWEYGFVKSLGGLGRKKRNNDCCFTLQEVFFRFMYSSPGYNDVYANEFGDQASCDMVDKQNYSEGTPDDGYHVYVTIRICWDVCNPDLYLNVSDDYFSLPDDQGKTAGVKLKVMCGNTPLSGETVKFVVASGPGQIDPPLTQTDAVGVAMGEYTVETKGTSIIRTEAQTCQIKPTYNYTTATIEVDTTEPFIYAIVKIRDVKDIWTFIDTVYMYLEFSMKDENVTVTGGGGRHDASCSSSEDNCSAIGLSAPNFTATGTITKSGKSLYVEFNPGLTPIDFTWYCVHNPPTSVDVPIYGNLVSSLIAMHVKGTVQMENESVVKGSGTESFGSNQPMSYEFEIHYSENPQLPKSIMVPRKR